MQRHKINYIVKSGIIELLVGSTGSSREEVWVELADIAQICANRLASKSQRSSWTQKEYPGTNVKVRVDMDKYNYGEDNIRFEARIKLANAGRWESFSSEQVQDFIDKILLDISQGEV